MLSWSLTRVPQPRQAGLNSSKVKASIARRPILVGACLATGDRILATGKDSVSKIVLRSCGCFLFDFRPYNHGLKGPRSPKNIAIIAVLRSCLSPPVFVVRSGPVWQQDLAILSPEGPRDSTCQLRGRYHLLQICNRLSQANRS